LFLYSTRSLYDCTQGFKSQNFDEIAWLLEVVERKFWISYYALYNSRVIFSFFLGVQSHISYFLCCIFFYSMHIFSFSFFLASTKPYFLFFMLYILLLDAYVVISHVIILLRSRNFRRKKHTSRLSLKKVW
jgi:hypothetical protein